MYAPPPYEEMEMPYLHHIRRRREEKGCLYACVFAMCCCFCCFETCEYCLEMLCCCCP